MTVKPLKLPQHKQDLFILGRIFYYMISCYLRLESTTFLKRNFICSQNENKEKSKIKTMLGSPITNLTLSVSILHVELSFLGIFSQLSQDVILIYIRFVLAMLGNSFHEVVTHLFN